jgi:hypothetical protein
VNTFRVTLPHRKEERRLDVPVRSAIKLQTREPAEASLQGAYRMILSRLTAEAAS